MFDVQVSEEEGLVFTNTISNVELFLGANIKATCQLNEGVDVFAAGFRGLNFIIKSEEEGVESTIANILKPKCLT